jgi:hypothetical protein
MAVHTETRSPLSASPGTEVVDLDDPEAVRRALALHRAGKAVFAAPFNSEGDGTLTWLDPRNMAEDAADGVPRTEG